MRILIIESPVGFNLYLKALTEEIANSFSTIEIDFGHAPFWNRQIESYDIIHIMWPDQLAFVYKLKTCEPLKERMLYAKNKGVKIVATCHNLHSHYKSEYCINEAYDVVYSLADGIIHLGQYSCELLARRYPNVKHVIIPHHIYDKYYSVPPTKEKGCEVLNFKKDCVYILVLGTFRNIKEQLLVYKLARAVRRRGITIIAPTFISRRSPNTFIKEIKYLLKRWFVKIYAPNIYIKGVNVSHEELPLYYAVADIAFIQRLNILNSGNLPMGFLMGKVVVGPNIGNIGKVLEETGNPTFDVNDEKSIMRAIDEALCLLENHYGEKNRIFAFEHWNTRKVAGEHVSFYQNLVKNR